jgi:hypothetical protein
MNRTMRWSAETLQHFDMAAGAVSVRTSEQVTLAVDVNVVPVARAFPPADQVNIFQELSGEAERLYLQNAVGAPTIGFLGPLTPSVQSKWTAAFVQRLRELDWIEGRTVAIEYRWADGRSERFAEIAAEFVRLKVSVIVTAGTAAVVAAKQATSASSAHYISDALSGFPNFRARFGLRVSPDRVCRDQ